MSEGGREGGRERDERCDCPGPNPLSPYFLVDKNPILKNKYICIFILK